MRIFFLLLLFIISACNRDVQIGHAPEFINNENQKVKTLIFAPHPLHNPERLNKMFGPIVELLNKELTGYHFKLEASRDYQEYNFKIKNQKPDILLPNPYQTLLGIKSGYHVFGKMGDDFNFKGIILVRKNSNINELKDLINKKIAFPAKSAVAATMLPRLYLHDHGLKEGTYYPQFVTTQESTMLAVIHGEADAASTWPMTWNSFSSDNQQAKEELKIIVETETLINNSLMYKSDMDPLLIEKIKTFFLNLHLTSEGKEILSRIKLSKFEDADDEAYKKVDKLVSRYKKVFGEFE